MMNAGSLKRWSPLQQRTVTGFRRPDVWDGPRSSRDEEPVMRPFSVARTLRLIERERRQGSVGCGKGGTYVLHIA
jgi:hypothetical protein